jgi:chromosome segregation ATPase
MTQQAVRTIPPRPAGQELKLPPPRRKVTLRPVPDREATRGNNEPVDQVRAKTHALLHSLTSSSEERRAALAATSALDNLRMAELEGRTLRAEEEMMMLRGTFFDTQEALRQLERTDVDHKVELSHVRADVEVLTLKMANVTSKAELAKLAAEVLAIAKTVQFHNLAINRAGEALTAHNIELGQHAEHLTRVEREQTNQNITGTRRSSAADLAMLRKLKLAKWTVIAAVIGYVIIHMVTL